jgi:S1-C subfamily serine protease
VYFVQSSGPDGAGTGTAWLYDDEGHLVTNEHVISGGTSVALRVRPAARRLMPACAAAEATRVPGHWSPAET